MKTWSPPTLREIGWAVAGVVFVFIVAMVASCGGAEAASASDPATTVPVPPQLDPATAAYLRALMEENGSGAFVDAIWTGGAVGVPSLALTALGWLVRGLLKDGLAIAVRTDQPITVQLAPADRDAILGAVESNAKVERELGGISSRLDRIDAEFDRLRDWKHDTLAPVIQGLQADVLDLQDRPRPRKRTEPS